MNYTIDKMSIREVCKWLLSVSNGDEFRIETQLAAALRMYYGSRNITMERTDILKDIFTKNIIDNGADVFRSMECDVTTHMQFIPGYEAHVD
jgi:hypothetical protein